MHTPEPLSDGALLAQARAGDRAAFRQLVERYEVQVATTVVSMLGPSGEVEDVAQETFIRFYGALEQFREEASIGTYLTRIAMNLSINALRRRNRYRLRFLSREHEAAQRAEPVEDGRERVEARERAALVQRALLALDPKYRAVVVLRIIDGYSTKETADILGIPLGTVLSRLSRAQDRLHVLLAPYLHDREDPSEP